MIEVRMYSIIIACIWIWGAFAQTRAEQKDVLMQMYFGTEGSSWRYAHGWNTDADICTWSNIFCDADGNVDMIDFENQRMRGTIPEVLGTLQTLTHMRLQKNIELKGTIPKSLFRLKNLRVLELTDNSLTGKIPVEINVATQLTKLQLTYNKLTGTLPQWNQMKNLEYLCFGGNKLTGTIPDIEGLHAIQRFSLFSNQLTGTIPLKHTLNNLEHLYLDDNKLSGELPANLGSVLPNLLDLYVSKNGFTGGIPPSVKSFTKLRTFYSFENDLSGNLPIEFNYMKNLIYLNISNNQFHGSLPNSMGSFHDLVELDVSANLMTGTLPPTYSTLTKLRTFAISKNKFSGSIPKAFSAWSDLEYFRASHNRITGTLPTEWGEIPYMIEMRLDNNKICGEIPDWLTSAPMIHTMTLDVNQWACPIKNYNDDQKLLCDYKNTMQCSSIPLTNPDTCAFLTTTTTTTGDPFAGIGANSFSEHLVYRDSECGGGEGVVKVLHDIYSEVACADEAYLDDACGPWYSYNSVSTHCECVLDGQKCHKHPVTGSSVYRIEYLSPHGHVLEKTHADEQPAEKHAEISYAAIGAVSGFVFSLAVTLCLRRSKNTELDEVLMEYHAAP